jgi:aryl-alcohol dehydrogenase-like predicted oxidoreductase
LGGSGLLVSEISMGNWITHAGQLDHDVATACVAAALDHGVNHLDTADVYAGTEAETVLGRALRGVPRESFVLGTKAFYPVGDGPNDRGLSRKHLTEALHASLRRLGTDYVDVFYLHRFDPITPLAESLRTVDDLVRQGKVLYVGVSEWTAGQLADALRVADDLSLDRIVVNQPQYNLLWRVIEAEVLPFCRSHGIGQAVWSPLAQGVLTGKYSPDGPLPAGSRALDKRGAGFIEPYLDREILLRVQRIVELAAEAGLTPVELALAWVLRQPGVSTAIVGASTPEQVRQAVRAADRTLDDDLVATVDQALGDVVERDPAKTDTPAQRP